MENNILDIKAGEGINLGVNGKEITISNNKSNPNLISNWYFGNPLNLQGQEYYSPTYSEGTTIDQFRTNIGAILEIHSEEKFIRFLKGTHKNPFLLVANYNDSYTIKKINIIPNKPYTLSVLYKASKGIACGVEGEDYIYKFKTLPEAEVISLYSATFIFPKDMDYLGFRIIPDTELGEDYNYFVDLYAIKFEQGETQTLAYLNNEGQYILYDTPPSLQKIELDLYGDNGIGHHNYLTNWNYLNPINQMGKTKYEGASQKTVDRVFTHANNTNIFRVNSKGFWELDCVDSENFDSKWLGLRQLTTEFPYTIENEDTNVASSQKRRVTVSALIFPYTLKYLIFRIYSRVNGAVENGFNPLWRVDCWKDNAYRNSLQLFSVTFDLPVNYMLHEFQILIQGSSEIGAGKTIGFGIVAAKVELGNRQTLARKNLKGEWELLDTLAPYQERLAICQQYMQVVPLQTNSTNENYIAVMVTRSETEGYAAYHLSNKLISPLANSILVKANEDLEFEGYAMGIFNNGYHHSVPINIRFYRSNLELVILRIVIVTSITDYRFVLGNSYNINIGDSKWIFNVQETY